MREKPVWVPLKKEFFDDWGARGKRWEVRRVERQWNLHYLQTGRSVRIGCGYPKKGDRKRNLYGVIGKVVTGSLDKIFRKIPFEKIEPRATSKKNAERMQVPLKKAKRYIAFEVKLQPKSSKTKRESRPSARMTKI